MKKIIVLLLCVGMIFSISACNDGSDNPGNVGTPDGSVLSEEQGEKPSDSMESEEITLNEYGMPVTVDNMFEVAQALIVTDVCTDLEYAIWNADFIYTACGMLVSSELELPDCERIEDRIFVPTVVVKQCVNAMFAGFDANTDPLPEIPENVNVVYDEATDRYGFQTGDYGAQSLKVIEWEESGSNGISMQVALFDDADGTQFSGAYDVFMNVSTYDGQNPIFDYMITSFVMIDDAPGATVFPEGGLTEMEALAKVESIYGIDGAADPDTGNITGYEYEGITEIEGVSYHNFRMTWLVIDENGEASHSSYLQNVFVSMDGSDILTGYRSGDGWEIMED